MQRYFVSESTCKNHRKELRRRRLWNALRDHQFRLVHIQPWVRLPGEPKIRFSSHIFVIRRRRRLLVRRRIGETPYDPIHDSQFTFVHVETKRCGFRLLSRRRRRRRRLVTPYSISLSIRAIPTNIPIFFRPLRSSLFSDIFLTVTSISAWYLDREYIRRFAVGGWSFLMNSDFLPDNIFFKIGISISFSFNPTKPFL